MKQPWVYMCSPSRSSLPPPSPPAPSRSSQCTRSERLSHASNLGWWSVSPLIVYKFRCCSLETSHPRLLPQSLKDCSINLCLFFCSAYRVIINICLHIKSCVILMSSRVTVPRNQELTCSSFKVILFMYLFLAVQALHCFSWTFSSCREWGLFIVVHRLLIVVAFFVVEHGF